MSKQCLKAALVCGAITVSVAAALLLGGCDSAKPTDRAFRLGVSVGAACHTHALTSPECCGPNATMEGCNEHFE